MKTVEGLIQGDAAWHAHRATLRNASDAPAMMGASPYVTRAELVRQYATGVQREIDEQTQRVFDRGHAVEPALRALGERVIREDFFPITGVSDDGYLGASFDGVTMSERRLLEVKQPNAEKARCIADNEIPPQDYWQIVQQFAVCETADDLLYLVGDGSESTAQLTIGRADIAHDIPKLLAGWRQFDADVEAYRANPPTEVLPPAPARRMDALPSLRVTATGMVTESNLAAWAAAARATLAGVNRELRTDEDFAEAESNVKGCAAAEERCEAAKQAILDQTADVAEALRELDALREDFRRARLDLDRLVKARKETVKGEIVAAGRAAVVAHYEGINASLGRHAIALPAAVQIDLAAAIKGLRTMASLQNAVDTAVANMKIAASQRADQVRAAVAAFEAEVGTFGALFPDAIALCATKAPEDLRNLMTARIGEHRRVLQAREDEARERIRKEEQERADREAREAIEADRRAEAQHAEQAATTHPNGAPMYSEQVKENGDRVMLDDKGNRSIFCDVDEGDPTPASLSGLTRKSVARIKLMDINAVIAPLSITAEGLASIGFHSVGTERAAKLYAAADLPRICRFLSDRLASAALKQAA